MSSATLKLKLDIINRIIEIEEVHIIEEIKQLLDFELNEELFELNEKQRDRIAEARKEYGNKETLYQREADEDIEQWLKEQ